ncbi:MAG: hypothetical protein AMJ68_04005 [Acidithiobacillales bacterium SG8_45]|jgi:hypothetical protein|nr:MAG: hypothetical protein AMJ68_04005 [Acidithiobacillales bacterium SG8_45]
MAKVDDALRDFVHEALARGLERTKVEKALLEAGWPADQVADGLRAFAETDFPVPVPRPKPYLSAKEAFLYLVLFTALYLSAFNLGSLIFQFINKAFPDPASARWISEMSSTRIRWSASVLIVAFPVYLYVSYLLSQAVKKDPVKRTSRVRKWLTYITLYIAAGALVGDLVTLVFNVLGGELTVRFVLKFLTVGVIAGGIFFYYLSELRKEEQES